MRWAKGHQSQGQNKSNAGQVDSRVLSFFFITISFKFHAGYAYGGSGWANILFVTSNHRTCRVVSGPNFGGSGLIGRNKLVRISGSMGPESESYGYRAMDGRSLRDGTRGLVDESVLEMDDS